MMAEIGKMKAVVKNSVSYLSSQDNFIVSAFVVAMGSNTDAKRAFAIAECELTSLGELQMSAQTVGLDFTGRTDLVYHNACAMVELCEPMSFADLYERLKYIENLCGRGRDRQIVPMDLDILAVFADANWQISRQRLPFKEHERVGLLAVADFLL